MRLERLQTFVQSIEPAAHLVEPRVLRRVVRLDRRLQGLTLLIPHKESYTIDRDRLLAYVDLEELAVAPGSDLPRRVVLLPNPDDGEYTGDADWPQLRERYRRSLFHACVHLELENRQARNPHIEDWGTARRNQIGDIEFAEIHDVLSRDGCLFQPPTTAEIYIEFTALALELIYFAPHDLTEYFPAIRDWQEIDRIFRQDLDHFKLFQRLQLAGDEASAGPDAGGESRSSADLAAVSSSAPVTLAKFRQLQADAEARSAGGNGVKAMLSHLRSARRAPEGYTVEAEGAAQAELTRFTQRLQTILNLTDDECAHWRQALSPLLPPAADGFWSNEARILYDLQKVCMEQERGVYRLDLIGWIRKFGKRAIRRPLPLMQDALALRHLRTVRRRIAVARITPAEKSRLVELLEEVLPRIETRSRDKLRQIIVDVFDKVGFVPANVLETVARNKIVEELLDRIVERNFLNMGDLRDAISKNNLKLPDVTTVPELLFGDCLLRADKQFDTALDGVYRRGAVYQRWPQTLSSMFFGTNFGRMLTRHLFVPIGGAFLTIEFLHHVQASIMGHPHPPAEAQHGEVPAVPPPAPETSTLEQNAYFGGSVVLLGLFFWLLLHSPAFRTRTVAFLKNTWSIFRQVVIDLPARVFQSQFVQRILASRSFAVLRRYVVEPAAIAGLVALTFFLFGYPLSGRTVLDVYFVTALFLNSPVGRYVSERTVDFMTRAWHDIKSHVIAGIVRLIMDTFDWLVIGLERMVYTVDEWLRFRAGDNKLMQGVKLTGGVVWFFVSYVLVFVFTLLVEPQINPIKHFPVVTVSHKLILPAGPAVAAYLTEHTSLSIASANTIVWTTIWLIPGIFGFLVWELKENWRLYAANRPKRLGASAIGHHGESMQRLLRPGIHSGTLPKSFAALRRLSRKGGIREENRAQRKRVAILHVEDAVKHFVERELVFLLEEVHFLPDAKLVVGSVRAATNRIDIELLRADQPREAALLIWEYHHGRLIGIVEPLGWIESLTGNDRQTLTAALESLQQLAGVDVVQSPLPLTVGTPPTWNEAVEFWSRVEREAESPEAGDQSPVPVGPSVSQA
jgi:hypothetical protein